MFQIWKEVLIPNCRQRDRRGQWFEFSDAQIKQADGNVKKMLQRGVPLPCVFEHVDLEAGDPEEWRANYAKHCFGHIGASRIGKSGSLELRHDLTDPEDVKRLKKNKFVSPKVRPSWSDSSGGEYSGTCVTHVALTPSPVQYWQKPFELSDSDAVYLSYAPPDEEECPLYAETFSEWLQAVELSMTADPGEETTVAEEDVPKKKDDGDGGGKGKKTLMDVIKALKDTGMNIPDEVEDECGLIIAIKSSKGDMEVVEEDPLPNPDADTQSAGGPPMVMSTLDRNPQRRKVAEREAKPEREEAAKRVNGLFESGRIDGPKKRAMLRVASATEMSFTADGAAGGKRWAAHLAELATLEKAAAWSAWKPTGKKRADGTYEMSATDPVPPPDFKDRAPVTPERAQVGADFLLGKVDYKDT